MHKVRSLGIAGMIALSTLVPTSTALAHTAPSSTATTTRPVVEQQVVPVAATKATKGKATKNNLTVTVPTTGCEHSPRVRVVRTTLYSVTVRATVTRPTAPGLICTMEYREQPVTITVPVTTRRVIDSRSGENLLARHSHTR